MTVNFLKPTKTNHITNKEYWREKLLEKISPIWKRIIYGLSWLGIVLLGILIGAKIFLSPQILWLKEIDIILFLFILVDFVIINGVFSKRGLKNEKFWFWFLLSLLLMNFVWSLGTSEYAQQGIYDFKIGINYLVIIPGLLLLKLAREKITQLLSYSKKISEDSENEVNRENFIEQKRKEEFPKKFSEINKIPILGWIIKWMYKEGWKYSLGLLMIFFLGLGLRIYNLGFLSPTGDEYRHLLAMKHYFVDGYFEYSNSYLTTYTLILIKKITNSNSLFLFRLPFAIMGSISIFLFYLLGKKINKTIGLIAAYLFAFLPLAIGLSRYIRGYEIILFISALFIYLFQTQIIKNIYIKLIIFVLMLKFITYIDVDPRFEFAFLLFVIFAGMYSLLELIDRIAKRIDLNLVIKYLLMIVSFIVGLYLIPKFTAYNILPEAELKYLYLINFYNSDTTWYFQFVPYILIALILIASLISRTKKNLVYTLFFIVAFTIYVYIVYFDAPRRFQARYIYNIIPYFITLLSVGVYYSYKIFKKIFHQLQPKRYLIISALIFLIIFNPLKTLNLAINEVNGEVNKKSQLAYFDAQELINFINSNNIDVSKIITTMPWIFDYYYNQPLLKNDIEKKEYIHFPWSYEFNDRTKIYSINGYWSEENINTIKEIIKNQDIEYLVFHAHPLENEYKYSFNYPLDKIDNTELMGIIDGDKTFGFYVYKIVR